MRRLILYTVLFVLVVTVRLRPPINPASVTVQVFLCDLDYYEPPVLPQQTLVLFCSGINPVRLWPWPPEQPWGENLQFDPL